MNFCSLRLRFLTLDFWILTVTYHHSTKSPLYSGFQGQLSVALDFSLCFFSLLSSVTPAPKMTSAVSPVANAVAHSIFNSLRLGRTSQFVVGRLICFWDSRNIKKNGEFMGITILLFDELVLTFVL